MTRGVSRKGFDIDLREGQAMEDSLAELLLGHGPLVEVKTDHKATSTGNVCLEFRQSGPPSFQSRPSGLAITVAHWWATVMTDEQGEPWAYVLRKTDDMKALGRRAYAQGRIVNGGDDDLFESVLIPVMWLIERAEAPQAEVPVATVRCGAPAPGEGERCGAPLNHEGPHKSDSWVWPKESAA